MTTCAAPASRVAPRPTLDTARLLALTLLPAPPHPRGWSPPCKARVETAERGSRRTEWRRARRSRQRDDTRVVRVPCTVHARAAVPARGDTCHWGLNQTVYRPPAAGAPTRPGLPGTVLLLALGFLCPGNLSESQASPNGRSSEVRGAAPSVPHT